VLGPERDNVFCLGHIARSVDVRVRHYWVHEPQRVQLHAGGHGGQCPGLVGVHRPCHRLHVARGTQLQQQRQLRWHMHVRRRRLRGLDRNHLHGRCNCARPVVVRVQHSRMYHTRRQKLEPIGHRQRAFVVPIRRRRLHRSGRDQLCGRRQHRRCVHVPWHLWVHEPGCRQLQPERHRRLRQLRRVLAAAPAAAALPAAPPAVPPAAALASAQAAAQAAAASTETAATIAANTTAS